MVQQTQPIVNQTQPVQQPVTGQQQSAGQTQPVEGQGETPVWKKWWFWMIIALVVIGAGVGIYFLLK